MYERWPSWQVAIDGIKYNTCEMSNVRYVNIIKVPLFKVTNDQFIEVANDLSLYVGSSLCVSDGCLTV